jgi:peptidyl-prolyl cis-trans isomerase C
MKRAAATLLGLLGGVALALAGCKEKALDAGSADGSAAHRTSDQLTAEDSAKVLAKVGDRTITLGDYVAALEHMDQFDRMRYQAIERRKELLQEMINVELLAEEARAKGYDKEPETEEEVRAVLRDAYLAQAKKDAPTPADIAPQDVQAYYDAHRAEFHDPERRRLSLVVTATEGAAKDVLAQAQKGMSPTEWGELVKAKSIDRNAKANVPVDLAGDVGLVSPPGDPRGDNPRVLPEVREAAFGIAKVGDVADHVVKGPDGRFYVVRLASTTPPMDRTVAESDRSIRVKLAQEKLRAREDGMLADLRTKFPVQVDDHALATVRVDLPDGGLSPDSGVYPH